MEGKFKVPLYYIQWGTKDEFNTSPILTLTIQEKAYTFMVDTGASSCFIDKKIARNDLFLNSLIQETDTHAISVSVMSNNFDVSRFIPKLEFDVGGKTFQEDFYIMDFGEDREHFVGLVGFNFLLRHKINLNLEKLYYEIKK